MAEDRIDWPTQPPTTLISVRVQSKADDLFRSLWVSPEFQVRITVAVAYQVLAALLLAHRRPSCARGFVVLQKDTWITKSMLLIKPLLRGRY